MAWVAPPSGAFRVIEANLGDGAESMEVAGADCLRVVEQRVAAYGPHAVALTEVCYSTYVRFAALHPTWDVHYEVTTPRKGPPTSNPTSLRCCQRNPANEVYESKGNVLAGPDLGTKYVYEIYPNNLTDPATDPLHEYRTGAERWPLLCAIVNLPNGPTRVCVTHLEAGSSSEQVEKRTKMLRTIQNLKDGMVAGVSAWGRPYIGGDFNANDNDPYWLRFLADTMMYNTAGPNAASNNNVGPGTYRLMDPQATNYVDHNLFRDLGGMTSSARSHPQVTADGVEYSTHRLQEAWVFYD